MVATTISASLLLCSCGKQRLFDNEVLARGPTKKVWLSALQWILKHQGHGGFTITTQVDLPMGFDVASDPTANRAVKALLRQFKSA